jgi:hypothetical protein
LGLRFSSEVLLPLEILVRYGAELCDSDASRTRTEQQQQQQAGAADSRQVPGENI